jgi:ABC-type multidrug transport system fused ATPase/permease subunit
VGSRDAASGREWLTLLKLCTPDWRLYIVAFVALTGAALGDAALPQLQARALNLVVLSRCSALDTPLVAALRRLGLVAVGTAAFTGLRGYLFWLVGSRLTTRLRTSLFSALMQKELAFHDVHATGELTSRLGSDCNKLGDVLSYNVNIVLRQGIQAVAAITIVSRTSKRLCSLVLGGVLARTLFSIAYAKVSRRLARAQTDALAATSDVAEQCLSLISTVRAHGTEALETRRYRRQLGQLLALQGQQGRVYGLTRVVFGVLGGGQLVGVIALGAGLVALGVLPPEALTSLVLYSEFIGSATGDIADNWARMQEALGAASQVFELLPEDVGTSLRRTAAAEEVAAGRALRRES